MPISDGSGGVALAAALWLAGCSGNTALVSRSFTPLTGPPVTALDVQDDALTITGPSGYCIDSTATRDRADGVFVMLGDCARLYSDTTESPEVSAVLTALISGSSDIEQLPSPAQLERYFRSEDGRAAVSVDGLAETVEILRTDIADETVFVLMRDSSAERPEGLSDTSWRAAFSLRDRLVSLAVTSHLEEPLPEGTVRGLLEDFVQSMLTANGQGITAAP